MESIIRLRLEKKRRLIEDEESEKIDEQLRDLYWKERRTIHILLLGNEGSGKSTLMKQVSLEQILIYLFYVTTSKG